MPETYRFMASVTGNADIEDREVTLQERPNKGEHLELDDTVYKIDKIVHYPQNRYDNTLPRLVLVDESKKVRV